ncbi:MAG: hypothetical protein ACE5J9_03555 [Methanosarcinales archaeon]
MKSHILILMLIASMMAIGCLENINLEPKEATPAIIPEEFLQEKGWIQSGTAHNQTQEIEVSGVYRHGIATANSATNSANSAAITL